MEKFQNRSHVLAILLANQLLGAIFPSGSEGEAGAGIEPAHRAFAEPGLTTWQSRREKGATDSPDP